MKQRSMNRGDQIACQTHPKLTGSRKYPEHTEFTNNGGLSAGLDALASLDIAIACIELSRLIAESECVCDGRDEVERFEEVEGEAPGGDGSCVRASDSASMSSLISRFSSSFSSSSSTMPPPSVPTLSSIALNKGTATVRSLSEPLLDIAGVLGPTCP